MPTPLDAVLKLRGTALAREAARLTRLRAEGHVCPRCTRILAVGISCPEHGPRPKPGPLCPHVTVESRRVRCATCAARIGSIEAAKLRREKLTLTSPGDHA